MTDMTLMTDVFRFFSRVRERISEIIRHKCHALGIGGAELFDHWLLILIQGQRYEKYLSTQ